VFGQVEVDIEASQVTPFCILYLFDLFVGKDLTTGRLLDVRQRQKPRGQQVAIANFLRRELTK
jgi:hypothetical protein